MIADASRGEHDRPREVTRPVGVQSADSGQRLGADLGADEGGHRVLVGERRAPTRGTSSARPRSFIASAGQAIAVLDAPAVGRTTFTRICALERLDELVTAEDVDPATARGLAAAGLRVTDR